MKHNAKDIFEAGNEFVEKTVAAVVDFEKYKAAKSAQPANNDNLPPSPIPAHPAPFAPQSATGLLGAIAQFAMDTAYRPSLEFSMMAGIAFVSALSNRRYITPSGHGMNIYLFGLSPPSFGKEHPQNLIKVLAKDAGAVEALLGPGEVSSGSAIEKVVRRSPNCLMIWDELGIILQGITARMHRVMPTPFARFCWKYFQRAGMAIIGPGKKPRRQEG
jgi:hypothetical protein